MKTLYIGTVCLFASVCSEGALSADNPPVRDGMPCFKEICVGDEIAALKNIKWEPSKDVMGHPLASQKQLSKFEEPMLKDVIADAAVKKAVIPYVSSRAFDNKGLSLLSQVRGVCVDGFLIGHYKSQSGHQTEVKIEPFPADDGSSQRFLVTSITRKFAGNVTDEQLAALRKDVDTMYQGVERIYGIPSHPNPMYQGLDYGRKELSLYYPSTDPFKRKNDLKKFPGCSSKPSLD